MIEGLLSLIIYKHLDMNINDTDMQYEFRLYNNYFKAGEVIWCVSKKS